ncbi:transposase [Streptomyces sp. NPDC001815]|uniref:transposase n=1 Tax=Streptomyces sp. NPDC001815 TaxID=3154526 RepID=UPI003332B858
MGRGELTDAARSRTEPLLPKHDDAGRRWRDHRQVVNGVLWRVLRGVIYRHGVRALQTVDRRFSQWERMVGGRNAWEKPRSAMTR